MKPPLLITGGAGFIGFHITKYILEHCPDCRIVSVDNINNYYDTQLKQDRLKQLLSFDSGRLEFQKLDINNREDIDNLFASCRFSKVIHLAAQAGVRYAREDPESYIKTNVSGFFNIIDAAAAQGTEHFIYASSSSVYGANRHMPFTEEDSCRSPMSLYAATKLSEEMLAASYFYTHRLKTIGLRLFNVYGPWGRPDMAYYKWADALTHNAEIELRNRGEMYRDMTYIDDVVQVITSLAFDYSWSKTAHDIFNVGNRNPVKTIKVLEFLQASLNVNHANIVYAEKGAEEPIKTFADTRKLQTAIGFAPDTYYEDGLQSFVTWYNTYCAAAKKR